MAVLCAPAAQRQAVQQTDIQVIAFKEAMATFFSNQLDFILFFYGLAFILLGSVCFAIARGNRQSMPWAVLGTFGLLHGTGEWLDLIGLIIGDNPVFAIARTGLMTLSFIFLFEFSRLEAIRQGFKIPGRWIYLPLVLLVAFGWQLDGLNSVNALARYLLGATGAAATSIVLAMHAKGASPAERRWIFTAVTGFALYGVAAGLIVPPAPNWHGDFFNYDDFANLTGTPVQLVRGLLACLMALSIWAFWGQRLMTLVSSPRYTKFLQKQFVATLTAMGAILAVGWVLTQYLGGIYQENVQKEAVGDLTLLSSRLAVETSTVDGMVKTLAASRAVNFLLSSNDRRDIARVDEVLRLDVDVSGARDGYIIDRSGAVVAKTKHDDTSNAESEPSVAAYFKAAMSGETGHEFAVDPVSKDRVYYASAPVRGRDGAVIGVVALKKSLDSFEADIRHFDHSFFLVDPHGVVIVTNRPELRFNALWPLPAADQEKLFKQYGALGSTPMMAHQVVGSSWMKIDGSRVYVQRLAVNQNGWSLVTWQEPQGIFASRVLGIIITLQMTIVALVYFVGRERWIHDNVQLEKRLELEELARNLDYRATTDPLTGLYNRRKFNRELATEILRAQRYKSPLSLVLYDIDHFKKINDLHGHQAGDQALIALSRFVSSRIRNSDVLARWGGEEFVILTPSCNGPVACQLAGNLSDAIGVLDIDGVGSVTCSFGVAEYCDGDTAETLLARADEALYRAKTNGRNRVELAQIPLGNSPNLQIAI
jgi:diguanylate cyclase (GGDEF)-like protein